MGRNLRRVSSFFILGSVLLAVAGLVLYQARYQVFPAAVYSRLDMLRQGTPLGKRIAHVVADQTIFLNCDGLKIAADLFSPVGPAPAPAILMLHGSSRWGRRVAITRLLSRKLAERGYLVLALDLRGFGDSDDPEPPDSPPAWKVENDIRAGVDFLTGHAAVQRDKIYVVGHSLGGAYGIYAGIRDERIGKIAAIGPPRRWKERFPREKDAFLARFARDRRLQYKITEELFVSTQEAYVPENTFSYFNTGGHKPLLLLDGALESEADKRFLHIYYERMTEPKQYATLGGTGHYLGIVGFEWTEKAPVVRNLMIYDEAIVENAVEVIDSFLGR